MGAAGFKPATFHDVLSPLHSGQEASFDWSDGEIRATPLQLEQEIRSYAAVGYIQSWPGLGACPLRLDDPYSVGAFLTWRCDDVDFEHSDLPPLGDAAPGAVY